MPSCMSLSSVDKSKEDYPCSNAGATSPLRRIFGQRAKVLGREVDEALKEQIRKPPEALSVDTAQV